MSIKRLFVSLLAIASLFAADSPEVAGRKALDLLLAGKHPEFIQMLTPAAKERLTPAFLKDQVAVEIDGFGKLDEIRSPVSAKSGNDTLISYPIKFAKVTVNVQFTITGDGKVGGLYFRPENAPLPPIWRRPPYSKPETFHEREVTVGSGEWQLPGTLTIPNGKGPFAAVVLVHGPGPNDRDETLYSNKMFKDLAEGLASRNVVVLRYEKRSKAHGPAMSSTAYTLKQETVQDAVLALAMLRKQPEVNARRIFVIGHSLGGYAMPRIVKEDGKLAGAIVLAGNARPIEDVVLDQNAYMLELHNGGNHEERQRMDGLKEEIGRVKALGPGKNNPLVVLGLPSEYLLDLKGYDPATEAKKLPVPMFFLQGQRDVQVTMKDYDRWRAGLSGRRDVLFSTYPALNHLFIAGKGAGNPAEYRQPGNVAPEVIGDIVKWIERY